MTKQLADLDFQGASRILNLPNATTNTEPATYGQLQSLLQGNKWKDPVRAATTANVTLSGTQTIDGVALSIGDRVLVKNQSSAAQNGLYLVASGAWTRTTDADVASEFPALTVNVMEGAINQNSQFTLTTDGTIVLGTTALAFANISQGASYTQGSGISISSNVIAVDTTVVARKAGATIGNGSATSFNVVHNLGTTDCVVHVREVASPYTKVEADISFPDNNTVTVAFASTIIPTTGQYRVSVIG